MGERKSRWRKIGVIGAKTVGSVIAFVLAAAVAGVFSKSVLGLSHSSMTIAYILQISAIAPIWYGARMFSRFFAAVAGMITGVGIWLTSLVLTLSTLEATAQAIGFIRVGGVVASFIVCVAILRAARMKASFVADVSA